MNNMMGEGLVRSSAHRIPSIVQCTYRYITKSYFMSVNPFMTKVCLIIRGCW